MSGEKNWLIRTTKHQILGPISKDKLLDFLNKNALSQNDEVSSGNGYWFLIRERDLVEKYILGDIVQNFNPISEAPNVLTAHLETEKTGTLNKVPGLDPQAAAPVVKVNQDSDEIKLPDESDLEFPDMDDHLGGDDNDITLVLPKAPVDKEAHLYADTPEIHTGGDDVTDITLIGDKAEHSAPAKKVKDTKTGEEVLVPSDDDLAYPDMGMSSSNDHEEQILVPDSSDLEYPDMEPAVPEVSSGGYEIPSAELLVDIPEEEEEPIPEPVIELEKKRPAAAAQAPAQRAQPARPAVTAKKASVYEEEEDEEEEEVAPVKSKKSKKKAGSAGPVHTPRNDRYLFFVLFLLLVLTMGVFYYYRKILNKPLPIIGIGDVEAQVINTQLGPIKKKHF